MSEVSRAIAELSPEQKALLELLAKKKRRALAAKPSPSAERLDSPATPQARDPRLAPIPVVPRSPEARFPLSLEQEHLWFLHQLDPESRANNVGHPIRITTEVDFAILERSLNEIVRRQEAWRTIFLEENGKPWQVVLPSLHLNLPVIDLRAVSSLANEARIQRLVDESAWRPFDLGQTPLVRVGLLWLGEQDFVLLLTVHHIVTDWLSVGLFWEDLWKVYRAFERGEVSPLAELTVQYVDFARWQRRWIDDQGQEHLQYWRERLADAPMFLDLPVDRPWSDQQTLRGARCPIAIGETLSVAVRRQSAELGASPFMILMAALKALLMRRTGQEKIVLGTPTSTRTHRELEPILGLFLNQIVFYTDLSGDPSFHELVERVRECTLGAFAHQDLPFSKLVEELNPPRKPGRPPIVQVSFFVLEQQEETSELVGGVALNKDFALWELRLLLREHRDEFRGWFEFATDLFDPTTIARMAVNYRVLLDAAMADSTKRLSGLPCLTPAQHHQLLLEWGDTERQAPLDSRLHAACERWTRQGPHAVALVSGENHLTRGALESRANQLARRLCALGVGPELRVALLVRRSPDWVMAQLAVLQAGGAFFNLDPELPEKRLQGLLADAEPHLVVVQDDLAGRLSTVLPVVSLKTARGDSEAPSMAPSAELAYLTYTSGSTGRPKGVLGIHQGVSNFFAYLERDVGLGSVDTVLQLAGLSFDASLRDTLGALACGTRVVLPAVEDRAPEDLLALAQAQRVTALLSVVPTVLRALSRAAAEGFSRLQTVRLLLVSGEVLDGADVGGVSALCGEGAKVVNQYGPTETTMIATYQPLQRFPGPGPVTVGRPLPNVRIYLLDPHLRSLPIGAPGEIGIAGRGVSRGYLGQPALTAESFLPDPVSGIGSRFYRTGDLARYQPDGELEFLRRRDSQLKIRGVRIEPAEIEAALRQDPRVAQAAVVAYSRRTPEGTSQGEILVAWVVRATDESAAGMSPETLRQDLRTQLPESMVPAVVRWIEELPTTPSGKTDRRALPDPGSLRGPAKAPRTPQEELLGELWRELLVGTCSTEEGKSFGVDDNFFALGGHSLLATQLVSRIRGSFDVEVPLRAIFEAPTLAGMAKAVERAQRRGRGLSELAMKPVSRDDFPLGLPLSYSQQRMWFLDSLVTNNMYNIATSSRLVGDLDVAALRRAGEHIVQRHEILRTRFATVADEPRQVVAERLAIGLPLVDLSDLPGSVGRQEGTLQATAEEARPFDLARLPLLRLVLIRLSNREHLLVVSIHHILADGWSMGVFFRELAAFYDAFRRGETTVLSALPIQFGDFAIWQRRMIEEKLMDPQLAYWRRQLGDAPQVLDLPLDHARPTVDNFRGRSVPFRVAAGVNRRLRLLGRGRHATPAMTFMAAFMVLLHRYSGQQDLMVGTVVANRSRKELEGLIGYLVNTLIMRCRCRGTQPFVEWVDSVRETALEAYSHQDLPFDRLVEELVEKRDLSRNPLCQVMLGYQNYPRWAQQADRLSISSAGSDGVEIGTAKFDLTMFFREDDQELHGLLEYNSSLFDTSTITRFLRHFGELLQGLAAGEATHVSEVPMLAASERHQLLVEWSSAAVPETLSREWSESRTVPSAVLLGELRAHVVKSLVPVPVGVSGELLVAGFGQSRGFRGGPGLDAEMLVPDLYGRRPGARLYRTGRLASWSVDGGLEDVGPVPETRSPYDRRSRRIPRLNRDEFLASRRRIL